MKTLQNSGVPHHPGSTSDSPQAPRRTGLFLRFLAALHESRRLQAAQIIRRHQHIITHHAEYMAMRHGSDAPKASRSQADDRAHAAPSDPRPMSLRGLAVRLLITLVIVGFGALHVVGGTLLDHRKVPQPSRSPAFAVQGD
jgi:hypothetical protein